LMHGCLFQFPFLFFSVILGLFACSLALLCTC